MRKYNQKILHIVILTLLLVIMTIATVFAQAEPVIRVGLWTNQANVIVTCETDYHIVDSDTKAVLGNFKTNEKVSISAKNHVLKINGHAVSSNNMEIVPMNRGCIEVNRRNYKGTIHIHPTVGKSGVTVVNILPIEQYLYGVIPAEMSPNWPVEAVKAQAVAARSFAYYNMHHAHNEDGFDVTAGTSSQVYGGWNDLAQKASKIVDSTRGLVITYQGKVVPAYFCSSAGGYTENSENVWGNYLPYLRGVPDFDHHSPESKWEKNMSVDELSQALSRAGYAIGKLEAIEVSRLTPPPVETEDRGISGRVKQIRFIGHAGFVELTGEKIRNILALKSTLFDVDIVVPAPKNIPLEMTDSFGDRQYKNMPVSLPDYKTRPLITDKENVRRVTGREREFVRISGFGWGHGLGMSQWGAKVMAEQAPKEDSEYFQTILKHYYRDIQIKKLY